MVDYELLSDLEFGFVFIFDGAAFIYIIYLILKNIFDYKIYGLTFWLLALLGLSIGALLIGYALLLKIIVLDREYGSNISQNFIKKQ